jgi:hypothetical protein
MEQTNNDNVINFAEHVKHYTRLKRYTILFHTPNESLKSSVCEQWLRTVKHLPKNDEEVLYSHCSFYDGARHFQPTVDGVFMTYHSCVADILQAFNADGMTAVTLRTTAENIEGLEQRLSEISTMTYVDFIRYGLGMSTKLPLCNQYVSYIIQLFGKKPLEYYCDIDNTFTPNELYDYVTSLDGEVIRTDTMYSGLIITTHDNVF